MRKHLSAIMFCLAATSGWAGSFQSISWGDLAENLSASDNPYYGLTADEAHLLGILVDVSVARLAGEVLSQQDLKGEEIALAALSSVGIDGAAKVLEVKKFDSRLHASRTALNAELLGQEVEILGFALPLSFVGVKVTEFLLVPYAGACIHTPPPPSNQVIFVNVPNGFEMRGLFDPVIVGGTISSSIESMSVELSDGNAEFPVGYQLKAEFVELFR